MAFPSSSGRTTAWRRCFPPIHTGRPFCSPCFCHPSPWKLPPPGQTARILGHALPRPAVPALSPRRRALGGKQTDHHGVLKSTPISAQRHPARCNGHLHHPGDLVEPLAAQSHRLAGRLGERCSAILLFGTGGMACILMALFAQPILSVAGMMALSAAGALFIPLRMDIQNRHISVANRATALSVHSFVMNLTATGTNWPLAPWPIIR